VPNNNDQPVKKERLSVERATISRKYQVIIPQRIRKAMQLAPGQKVQMLLCGDRIELIPEKSIQEMRGFLKGINTNFERDEDRL
jgi:AbrB family looped-hinge helix DNA binding protein